MAVISLSDQLKGRRAIAFGISGALASPLVSGKACGALVHRALAEGCTIFDTAPSYGAGEGERRLGGALANDDRAFVMTKAGLLASGIKQRRRDFSPEGVRLSVNGSLERLERPAIDLLWLHGLGSEEITAPLLTALEDMKASGLVHHFGITGRTHELAAAFQHEIFEAVMLPVNPYMDQACRGIVQAARNARRLVFGIEIMSGQRTGAVTRGSLWRTAQRLASGHKPPPPSSRTPREALSWALDHGGADIAVTTTTSAKHLSDNLRSMAGRQTG